MASRRRDVLKAGLSLLFVAAALVWLGWTMGRGGWRAVGQRLAAAHAGWVALAVLVMLVSFATWAVRWRALLRPVVRAPLAASFRALMASVFVNTVVPFARSLGGLVRARFLARATGGSMAGIYGPTLVDQIGYSTMSVCLGAMCVPFALWGGGAPGGSGRSRSAAMIALGVVVLLVAILALRSRAGRIVESIRTRVPGAAGAVEAAIASARRTLASPATWPWVALGGAAVWALNVATFWIAGRATGAVFGFGPAAAAWSLGSAAGIGSGTPGGIGTTESAAILPLVAAGVPEVEALAAVVLARLVQYTLGLGIGAACFLGGATSGRPGGLLEARLEEAAPDVPTRIAR